MKHLLQQKVRAVARRATRVVLAHAVLQVVAGVIAAGLILGGLDYLIRFQDPGVRWLSSLGWLAVLGWTWRRYLRPALRYRPTDVAIAQHIEQMSPTVRSNLASSIAFLSTSPDDATAGSAQLRRAVIEKTAVAWDDMQCNAVVSSAPARRIAVVACVFAAIVCVAAVGNRRAVLLAAQRLAAPWAALPWPRRHALEFENPPQRIAAGEPFEVQLHDRNGELPERVEIQILSVPNPDKSEGAAAAEASNSVLEPSVFAMTLLDGKMVYRRNNVQRPFRYRAIGGDDDSMPWISLAVVEAVNLEALRVEVRPPAYTGWPVVHGEGDITTISGSRVLLAGRASRALHAASVVVEGEEKREIALELSDDHTSFRLTADAEPWVLEKSGFYWLKFVDQDDVVSGAEARWDLHITPDRAPTVALESPSGATYLTVGGFLEVEAHCQDDLLLHSVELRYRRHDEQEEHVIPLYAGSDAAPAVEMPQFHQAAPLAIKHRWSMESVAGLAAGSELRFYLAAQDYKPQEGRSPLRSVHIIGPDELQDRLAHRQGEVLAGLLQALRMQRQARSQTESLGIQLDETKSVAGGDVAAFQNALLHQQNVQREIAGESGGVAAKIESVLARLESSGVQNVELQERFQNLQARMHRLAEGQLPRAEMELLEGLDAAREHGKLQPGDGKPDLDDQNRAFADTTHAVKVAGRLQESIIGELEEAVEDFQQWGRFQSLAREARQLQKEQEELRKQTSKQRLQTLAKSAEELSAQQRADLKKLAARQQGVAERFQSLENDMERAAEQMREQKNPAAQTLDDALRATRGRAASARVRESSRRISENRLGEALAAQRNAEQALEEVLDILSHRRTHELQRIVEGLSEARQELGALQEREQKIEQALAGGAADNASSGASKKSNEEEMRQAAETQQTLAQQMQQLARQLKRLRADQAAEALQAAASDAQKSSQAAENNNRPQAHQAAQDAQPRIEEARQAVLQALQQARIDHLHEQLQLLAGALDGLLPRQQGVFDEVRRINQGSTGKLGARSAISALGKQEDAQRAVAQEAQRRTKHLQLPSTFEFGLAGAVREMERTASALGRHEAEAAVAAARRAVQRLEALRAAIRASSKPAREPKANPAGKQNQPGADAKNSDALPSLAELRLLKQMQDGVNRRTSELNSARSPTSGLTPSQNEELQQLAEEQSRLAEILAGFRAALADAFSEPSDEPSPDTEALPELDDLELLPRNNEQE